MDKIKLSVVIPTLNEEKFISHLLNDLSNQTYQDFEVVVVDAGSIDNTAKIVDSYRDKLKLTFYNLKIKNVSIQRNYGGRHAKGNYLFFIDADMRLSNGFIKKIIKNINKSKGLIYLFRLAPISRHLHDQIIFNIMNNLLEISQYTLKPFAPGGNMVFQKDFFLFLGGFDKKSKLSEDHELIQRAKQRGVTAKFINNLYAKFSMRRFQHEGRLAIFIKYSLTLIYTLKRGKVEKSPFEYQMGGGQYYRGLAKDKKTKINFNDYLKKLKSYLSEISNS